MSKLPASVRAHFQRSDPVLYPVIVKHNAAIPVAADASDYLYHLCSIIIGQQLSNTVADTIVARFDALFGKKKVTAKNILAITDDVLRGVGMSWSKVKSIKDTAAKVAEGSVVLATLGDLSDEQVMEHLTKIKGVGPWTVEMFLMFTLGREDVYSYGDLGLKRAIQSLYGYKREPSLRTMQRLASRWKPYRTYAALALWRHKDA